MRPARAEAIFVAKRGEYLVAGQTRAIVARLVKALTIGEFQQSCQSGMEAGRLCGFEFEDNRIALIECQLARSGPRLRDFQLVDLFIQPPLLKERMRLGQARLFVEEGASADLGRFQRTLKENDADRKRTRLNSSH